MADCYLKGNPYNKGARVCRGGKIHVCEGGDKGWVATGESCEAIADAEEATFWAQISDSEVAAIAAALEAELSIAAARALVGTELRNRASLTCSASSAGGGSISCSVTIQL